MNLLFKIIVATLLLKKGPQDFPYSTVLMRLSLLVYFLTGLPSAMMLLEFELAVLNMAMELIVLLLFVYLCLQAFSKMPRFTQTVTALACVSTVFKLMILPLLSQLGVGASGAADGTAALSLLLMLVLYSWLLATYTHIFRASFEVRLPSAMALTICFVIFNLLAAQLLFPELN